MSEQLKPTIAQCAPYKIEVEAGTYSWCSCGMSKNQPFCDGSHKGSDFRPVKVVVEEKKTISFCGCKHSKAGFKCDGAHKNLQPQ